MKSPRTICILLMELGMGGVQRMAINLAQSLKDEGAEPSLLVRYDQRELWPLIPPGVPAICLKTRNRFRGFLGIARVLREQAPDILLTSGVDALIALAARWMTGAKTKIVICQHGPFRRGVQPPFVGLKHRIYRWMFCHGDGFVAVSEGVAGAMVEELGIARSRITVIYNPIILPDHKTRAAEPLEHPFFAPGAPAVFLGVGRLVEQKDFATLLAAFAAYRRQQPGRLIILGEGPLRAGLERQAVLLGIAADVDFAGMSLNPAAYMARATALVNTSLHGGMESVLVEALAAGTAVICTDCDFGSAEAVGYGQYGTLVRVGDVDALAKAMRDVASGHRTAADQIAFADAFSSRNSAQHYLQLAETLLRQG